MTGPAEVFTGHPAGPICLEAAMPRETCTIHVSPRDMNELLNALAYVPFRTSPIHTAGVSDPRQTLWGFPIIVSNATFRPHMAMRWGDTVHYHQLTLQEVMDPGVLDRVAEGLDSAAHDTAARHRYANEVQQNLSYQEQMRSAAEQYARMESEQRILRQNAEWVATLPEWATTLPATWNTNDPRMRTVTNRRSKIRSIIIEKET